MMTVHLSCALTSQHLQWYNNEWLMIANSKSQLLTCVVRGRNVDGNYRRQISHVISTYYKNCHSQSLSFKLWYGFCTPPLITTFCTHCQTPGSSPWCRGSSAMTQASQPNCWWLVVILVFPFEPVGHMSTFSFNSSVQFLGWEIEVGVSAGSCIDLFRFTTESA